jgi:hypothetical protein
LLFDSSLGIVVGMNADNLARAFIRGAALAATLSACGSESALPTQSNLDPIPDRTYPYCVGPDYGNGTGYSGQCCGDIRCTDPLSGTCPETSAPEVTRFLPPGSGTCECADTEGPFFRSIAAPASEVGDCCYVVYAIGCLGRPLTREGGVFVAAVLERADWLGGSAFPAWSQTPAMG